MFPEEKFSRNWKKMRLWSNIFFFSVLDYFSLFLYRSIFREIETPRKVFWQWNQNQFPALFMGLLLNHFPENLIFTYILHQNYRVQKYFSQVFTLYPSLSKYLLLSQFLNIYCLDSISKEASLKDTRIWVLWCSYYASRLY